MRDDKFQDNINMSIRNYCSIRYRVRQIKKHTKKGPYNIEIRQRFSIKVSSKQQVFHVECI